MKHYVKTTKNQQFIDITKIVEREVKEIDIKDGLAIIFVPHTTAGITINENADSDVVRDILTTFERVFPENGDYRHMEGNSHAHIKSSLMGQSLNVIIEGGRLKLGTWQGIYFCEFDGPRNRELYIKLLKES